MPACVFSTASGILAEVSSLAMAARLSVCDSTLSTLNTKGSAFVACGSRQAGRRHFRAVS